MRAAVVLLIAIAASVVAAPAGAQQHSLRSPITDENFYFVMADRFENGDTGNDLGGLTGDRTVTGFDPKARGWYHGGDLKGLIKRIDYIRGLGTDSIWLTPSFKNKPVQGEGANQSAAYHGYWITDFTQIDPHLGTNQDLTDLIAAAHRRGMKVYFDIITNHTADVIGFEGSQTKPYVSKDAVPYKTAAGTPFDDRDYAGDPGFPALDAATSFPYKPVVPAAEATVKVPDWLNDPTYYHNRGDTTFYGEDSLYGDFFGLDDLFTEHPRVVRGMIDIYKGWIRDFGVDGFRIDTMKHVNDEFWQEFGPEVLEYARERGKSEFFMFGEVFDTESKPYTSRFTTTNKMQSVLDFPFQQQARNFAAGSQAATKLESFFEDDDWYTDADSNAYQLPTFLGNHDMGRIGLFIRQANAGADDAEVLQRDKLAHELMYFSRGNPVIYYGDEQGFVGDGGDQLARQDMFKSQVPEYNDDDLIGTDATTADENFDTGHPLYRAIARLASLTRWHTALRDGALQHRYADQGAGIYAFSRMQRRTQREYVVAFNNSESAQTAAIPTYTSGRSYYRVYGEGESWLRTNADRELSVTVPALSAVVYKLAGRVPRSRRAPSISLAAPAVAAAQRGRVEVRADVGGDSFYEVTFQADSGEGWEAIGTDDNAPYRVFHDVSGLRPGTEVRYRAVVLDNAGHTRRSGRRATTVPPAVLQWDPRVTPEGSNVRNSVPLNLFADPERATHVVRFERSVDGGAWTTIATDSSSPQYSVSDDIAALPVGTEIRYRAILTDLGATSTSEIRTVRIAAPVTTAIVHYNRAGPAADYADWGLHLWGDAVADSVLEQITWAKPWPRTGVDAYGAFYEIAIKDDTKPVNFILHRPSGDSVPDTREPGGDRAFVPIATPEIWLKQGDATIYTSPPPTG